MLSIDEDYSMTIQQFHWSRGRCGNCYYRRAAHCNTTIRHLKLKPRSHYGVHLWATGKDPLPLPLPRWWVGSNAPCGVISRSITRMLESRKNLRGIDSPIEKVRHGARVVYLERRLFRREISGYTEVIFPFKPLLNVVGDMDDWGKRLTDYEKHYLGCRGQILASDLPKYRR